MMTNRAAEFHHSNAICDSKESKDPRSDDLAMVRVIETKSFPLDCRDMCQARVQEGIQVLRMPWARNNTPREDIVNLVVLIWCISKMPANSFLMCAFR
jgi:hypothetical protein